GPNVSNCNRVELDSIDSKPGTRGTFTGTSSDTVKIGVKRLQLPIQNILGVNPIELIKRGLPTDLDIARLSPLINARYYYKPGLRITLTDYQVQLPRTVLSTDSPSAGTGP